jgi:hypothetical protein
MLTDSAPGVGVCAPSTCSRCPRHPDVRSVPRSRLRLPVFAASGRPPLWARRPIPLRHLVAVLGTAVFRRRYVVFVTAIEVICWALGRSGDPPLEAQSSDAHHRIDPSVRCTARRAGNGRRDLRWLTRLAVSPTPRGVVFGGDLNHDRILTPWCRGRFKHPEQPTPTRAYPTHWSDAKRCDGG